MWRIWKSSFVGWSALAAVLLIAVPLYVRLPLWLDASLYDVAARNLQKGGVHYRDVFDTNLPGMLWLHLLIRSTCGWSSEALRFWDAVIITGSAWILLRWLRRLHCPGSVGAWFAVALALCYPVLREINHCQRDSWMLLPALLATQFRLQRSDAPGTWRRVLVGAIFEGCCWGTAFWLKPHIIVPALAVWLCSALRLLAGTNGGWRHVLADTAGNGAGALLIAIPGCAWMIASGCWPHFWNIVQHWNTAYMSSVVEELPERADKFFYQLRPWSLTHALALPLAFVYLGALVLPTRLRAPFGRSRMTRWLFLPSLDDSNRWRRGMLAALYCGWIVQVLFLQRSLEYVHVPAVFLALALLASQRWSIGFAAVVWFAGIACFGALSDRSPRVAAFGAWVRGQNLELHEHYLGRHQLLRTAYVRLWPRCLSERPNASLKVDLAYALHPYCATNWSDLERTAEFLRTVAPPLRDRELICWHDSPHSLYLLLDLQPALRFMHVATATQIGPQQQEQVRQELRAASQRYVVSDIMRVLRYADDAEAPGTHGPLDLPPLFPASQRNHFPWTEPIVFRAGRYVVQRVENPVGTIDMPKKPLEPQEHDGQ